jgi:hypothetical protein
VGDERVDENESMDTRAGLWVLAEVFKWPRSAQIVFVCVVCFGAGGAAAALMLASGHLR